MSLIAPPFSNSGGDEKSAFPLKPHRLADLRIVFLDAFSVSLPIILHKYPVSTLNFPLPCYILFLELCVVFIFSIYRLLQSPEAKSKWTILFRNPWIFASIGVLAASLPLFVKFLENFDGLAAWTMILPALQRSPVSNLSTSRSNSSRSIISKSNPWSWLILLLVFMNIYSHYRLTEPALINGGLSVALWVWGTGLLNRGEQSLLDHGISANCLSTVFSTMLSGAGLVVAFALSMHEVWPPSQPGVTFQIMFVLICSGLCLTWLFYSLIPRKTSTVKEEVHEQRLPSFWFQRRSSLQSSSLTILAVNGITLTLESLLFGIPVISAFQYATFFLSLAIHFHQSAELPNLPARYKWLSQLLFKSVLVFSIIGCFFDSSTTSLSSFTPSKKPNLDKAYVPDFDLSIILAPQQTSSLPDLLDLVIDINQLPNIKPLVKKLFIYQKANFTIPAFFYNEIDPLFDAVQIVPIESANGSESRVFLSHIEDTWYTISTHNLFLPDIFYSPPSTSSTNLSHPFHHQSPITPHQILSRLKHYFEPKPPHATGFLSLGPPSYTMTSCLSPTDSSDPMWSDPWHIFHRISSAQNHKSNTPCNTALVTKGSAFVVSAQRVRGVDREIIEQLSTLVTDAAHSWKSAAHARDKVARAGLGALEADCLERPVVEREIEKVWGLIMQCSEERIARRCPSMMSGTRMGGRSDDCACVDGEMRTF